METTIKQATLTSKERVKALATHKQNQPISIYCGQNARTKEAIYANLKFACTVSSVGKAIQHANEKQVQGVSFIIHEFDTDEKTVLLDDNAWQLLHSLIEGGILAEPTFRDSTNCLTYQILSFDSSLYAEVTA